jgi:uncharacterized membrane protein YfcA
MNLLPVSLDVFLLASAIVVLGTMLQGSIGFGLGTLGVPLLLLLEPAFVPGPTLAIAFFLTLMVYWRDRAGVRSPDIGWGVLGRVLGTLGAMGVLSLLPGDWMAALAAGLVLLAVVLMQTGIKLNPSRGMLDTMGSVSGFMGTIASVGGPPMAMLYAGEKGPRIRGTLSGIFFFGTLSAVTGLAVIGRFGTTEIGLTISMFPALLVGFALSRYTARFLDKGYIRPTILVVSGLAALLAIVRYAF